MNFGILSSHCFYDGSFPLAELYKPTWLASRRDAYLRGKLERNVGGSPTATVLTQMRRWNEPLCFSHVVKGKDDKRERATPWAAYIREREKSIGARSARNAMAYVRRGTGKGFFERRQIKIRAMKMRRKGSG